MKQGRAQDSTPVVISDVQAKRSQGAEMPHQLVEQFDTDNNGRLNLDERTAARQFLKANPRPSSRRRSRRPLVAGKAGVRIAPSDVKPVDESVGLYDLRTLRTLFLEFESPEWEQELAAFWHTDVKVDAKLTVDGREYPDVGVNFKGNNSFTAVPDGSKRSLSVDLDFVNDQELLGYSELKLLNSNQDPTFLRSVLYLMIARDYLPALKANLVRVVINGEDWGIYVNQQAFKKEFFRDELGNHKGTRWKSPNNSPGGGLAYLGDDLDIYRRWYEIKGSDTAAKWHPLVEACRALHTAPPEHLRSHVESMIDIDVALRFLAIDMALVNNDGYWNDGCDFNIYSSKNGRLCVTPHDANEGFRGGRDGSSGPDPLIELNNPLKALRSKLLADPECRRRYLVYVGDIAEKWLDWDRLGPIISQLESLIQDEVAIDTRKHDTAKSFHQGIYGDGTMPAPTSTLKGFVTQRRAFLLNHPEVQRLRDGPSTK